MAYYKNHKMKKPNLSDRLGLKMAERQGFEPWVALLPQLISSQSRSATPASLHGASLLPEPPLEINLNLFKDQTTAHKTSK